MKKPMISVLESMDNEMFVSLLEAMGACDGGVDWAKETGLSAKEAFYACPRGDWLGWFIKRNLTRLGYTEQQWARALSEAIMTDGWNDPHIKLIDALEDYADGRITREQLLDIGYVHGLTDHITFPQGQWLNISAPILRKHFDIFKGD